LDYHGRKEEDVEKAFEFLRKENEAKLKKKIRRNNKTVYVYKIPIQYILTKK